MDDDYWEQQRREQERREQEQREQQRRDDERREEERRQQERHWQEEKEREWREQEQRRREAEERDRELRAYQARRDQEEKDRMAYHDAYNGISHSSEGYSSSAQSEFYRGQMNRRLAQEKNLQGADVSPVVYPFMSDHSPNYENVAKPVNNKSTYYQTTANGVSQGRQSTQSSYQNSPVRVDGAYLRHNHLRSITMPLALIGIFASFMPWVTFGNSVLSTASGMDIYFFSVAFPYVYAEVSCGLVTIILFGIALATAIANPRWANKCFLLVGSVVSCLFLLLFIPSLYMSLDYYRNGNLEWGVGVALIASLGLLIAGAYGRKRRPR